MVSFQRLEILDTLQLCSKLEMTLLDGNKTSQVFMTFLKCFTCLETLYSLMAKALFSKEILTTTNTEFFPKSNPCVRKVVPKYFISYCGPFFLAYVHLTSESPKRIVTTVYNLYCSYYPFR